jgi:hypothetical protein
MFFNHIYENTVSSLKQLTANEPIFCSPITWESQNILNILTDGNKTGSLANKYIRG